MVNKNCVVINLKNKNKGQMTIVLGVGIILLIALAVVIFFLVKGWQSSGGLLGNSCGTVSPDSRDRCCVDRGLGNRFDVGVQKCITYTPPAGNPVQLPLVSIVTANGTKLPTNPTNPAPTPVSTPVPINTTLNNTVNGTRLNTTLNNTMNGTRLNSTGVR
jgi:hypothetical protein